MNADITVTVHSILFASHHKDVSGYLYSHSALVGSTNGLGRLGYGTVHILATSVRGTDEDHTASFLAKEALRLAQYQCDRFESALYPTAIIGTLAEAQEAAVSVAVGDRTVSDWRPGAA